MRQESSASPSQRASSGGSCDATACEARSWTWCASDVLLCTSASCNFWDPSVFSCPVRRWSPLVHVAAASVGLKAVAVVKSRRLPVSSRVPLLAFCTPSPLCLSWRTHRQLEVRLAAFCCFRCARVRVREEKDPVVCEFPATLRTAPPTNGSRQTSTRAKCAPTPSSTWPSTRPSRR